MLLRLMGRGLRSDRVSVRRMQGTEGSRNNRLLWACTVKSVIAMICYYINVRSIVSARVIRRNI